MQHVCQVGVGLWNKPGTTYRDFNTEILNIFKVSVTIITKLIYPEQIELISILAQELSQPY